MYPVLTKHFSELSTREYHRIVQAREAVFFLEQHITEPDADAIDPQSVFMWMEDGGRVVAFLRIIPAGIAYAEASVGRVLVDASYRRRGLCRSLMSEALRYIVRTSGCGTGRGGGTKHRPARGRPRIRRRRSPPG